MRPRAPLWGLLLLLQLCSSHPVSTGLTDSDLDLFKVSLQVGVLGSGGPGSLWRTSAASSLRDWMEMITSCPELWGHE